MTEIEEIFKDKSGLASEYGYNVEVIELSNAIELAKQYAKHKLDEAISKVGSDGKIDIHDLIDIKNNLIDIKIGI